MLMIIVIGIFIAIEPKLYDRGLAWMLPVGNRADSTRSANKVGFTLRRLLFGRHRRHGVRRGLHLHAAVRRRRADGRAARPADRLAGLHPQHRRDHFRRADGRGRLFAPAPGEGLWAIFVYFFVQNVDGYLVVPYIARRTVDLAPALVLAAQLLFGALFGILGLLLADPILATIKVTLAEAQRRAVAGGSGPARAARVRLKPSCWLAAAGPPRISAAFGTTCSTWTSKARSSLGPIGLPGGGFGP